MGRANRFEATSRPAVSAGRFLLPFVSAIDRIECEKLGPVFALIQLSLLDERRIQMSDGLTK
jgi:hypothetical protein